MSCDLMKIVDISKYPTLANAQTSFDSSHHVHNQEKNWSFILGKKMMFPIKLMSNLPLDMTS